MSQTSDVHCVPSAHRVLNCSTVAEIQEKVIEKGERSLLSRLAHARNDKEVMATWRSDLNRVLHVFNVRSAPYVRQPLTAPLQTQLAVNTHMAVLDIHRSVVTGQGATDGQRHSASATSVRLHQHTHRLLDSTQVSNLEHRGPYGLTCMPRTLLGELPPPSPSACFGRDELIEAITGFAEGLKSIALIGAGGIGKTSIALTVLHNDRIKKRFGENRRFIRCDQFPASRVHFLSRLSKVVGAGVENPEDLTPLRPFLSSRDMIIFLDNAESILDPQGTGAREIYTLVEELGRFNNICLCVTSRISTVPPYFKRPAIPTLSAEAARDIFYGIYEGGRSDIISDLLKRLDFHALSITLLATVSLHNMWDCNRVAMEWDAHHTQVLRTEYNESLAATIELSLASPTFCELGPDARDLLGVIAFFPQGVDQNNLDWLFPDIPNRRTILDKFCVLSLTHRSNSFVTMLAPLRDYLYPEDPLSSPLLCKTKEQYLNRLSARLAPDNPAFGEAQWIVSEDVNVEHLLDVFTSADPDSDDTWDACINFMCHLYWHKPRLVLLGPKFESLPDTQPSKTGCLVWLSRLFGLVGNNVEEKRLLVRTLELRRERSGDLLVAITLNSLADVNRMLGLYAEGIENVKESLEIFERLDRTSDQADAYQWLARLLYDDSQLDAAEEAASRSISLFPTDGEQFRVCQGYRVLGNICRSKGKTEEAINHFERALGIASLSNWYDQLFWIHYSLAELFSQENKFDDTDAHIKHAKSHVANDEYCLGRAMELQARSWYEQSRFEEARSEALCAAEVFGRVGATKAVDFSRNLLRNIEEKMKQSVASGSSSDSNGELQRMGYFLPVLTLHLLARGSID